MGLSYQHNFEQMLGLARLPERDRSQTPPNSQPDSRGLEMSVVLGNRETWSFSAWVTPPRQRYGEIAQAEPTTVFYVGAVNPFAGFEPDTQVTGPLLVNESPLGRWAVEIQADGMHTWERFGRNEDSMRGLILHLVLTARAAA
jgi:hypothetical protein